MADIGARIRSKREQIGLTQEELAKALGYKNKSTIAKIENGTNDIVQSKVVEFANVLHTTVAYLMGWEDDKLDFILSDEEKELIIEYRKADSVSREAVQRLLLYYSKISASGPYANIPASPEELEKKYPPVDIDDAKGKIG